MAEAAGKTWIFTGSLENFRINAERGFDVIGAPIWPLGKRKRPEQYPWRVSAQSVVVLDEEDFVPAEALVDALEHVAKWPAEHWHLAFQGQLRAVSEADAAILRDAISRAPAPAGAA